jgi:hypothetical protein
VSAFEWGEDGVQDSDEIPLEELSAAVRRVFGPRTSGRPVHPLTGRWAPDLPLRVDGRATRVAELLRTARPVPLDLAGRADILDAARGWRIGSTS